MALLYLIYIEVENSPNWGRCQFWWCQMMKMMQMSPAWTPKSGPWITVAKLRGLRRLKKVQAFPAERWSSITGRRKPGDARTLVGKKPLPLIYMFWLEAQNKCRIPRVRECFFFFFWKMAKLTRRSPNASPEMECGNKLAGVEVRGQSAGMTMTGNDLQ